MRFRAGKLICIAWLVSACARSAPVDLDLVKVEDGAPLAWLPRYVDVRHADHGWQRVPIARSAPKMEAVADGHRVRLATSLLPMGRYTAIRVGYLVPAPDSVHEAEAPEIRQASLRPTDQKLEERETVILRAFCVDGRGDADLLVLDLERGVGPPEDPQLILSHLPDCSS